MNKSNSRRAVTNKRIVRHCEDCQFREWVGDSGLRCLRGHKSRFYNPRNGNPYDDYGWKRRCADFVMGDHVQVIHAPNNGVTGVTTAGRNVP